MERSFQDETISVQLIYNMVTFCIHELKVKIPPHIQYSARVLQRYTISEKGLDEGIFENNYMFEKKSDIAVKNTSLFFIYSASSFDTQSLEKYEQHPATRKAYDTNMTEQVNHFSCFGAMFYFVLRSLTTKRTGMFRQLIREHTI